MRTKTSHPHVCKAIFPCTLISSDVLLYKITCFLNGNGGSDNNVNTKLVGKLVNLFNKGLKACDIVVSDLKCGIYKEICYVVVAGKNTGYEAVKSLRVENKIIVGIDETSGVLNVKTKSNSLFKTTVPSDFSDASFTIEMSVFVLPVPLTPMINLSINVLLCRASRLCVFFDFLRNLSSVDTL